MPTEDEVTRKLRAILSADVKGYSLLMSDDEAFTVKTLESYRKVMSAQIVRHKGRVVDAPGDNMLFINQPQSFTCHSQMARPI